MNTWKIIATLDDYIEANSLEEAMKKALKLVDAEIKIGCEFTIEEVE